MKLVQFIFSTSLIFASLQISAMEQNFQKFVSKMDEIKGLHQGYNCYVKLKAFESAIEPGTYVINTEITKPDKKTIYRNGKSDYSFNENDYHNDDIEIGNIVSGFTKNRLALRNKKYHYNGKLLSTTTETRFYTHKKTGKLQSVFIVKRFNFGFFKITKFKTGCRLR